MGNIQYIFRSWKRKDVEYMIINGSTINMASSRKYDKAAFTKQKTSFVKKGLTSSKNDAADAAVPQKSVDLNQKLRDLEKERTQEMVKSYQTAKSNDFTKAESKEEAILQTLRKILESLRSGKKGSKLNKITLKTPDQELSNLVESIRKNSGFNQSIGQGTAVFIRTEGVHIMAESEYTSFSSTGSVKTADGREINFNVELEMSRSFMEANAFEKTETIMMRDPLVINMGTNTASVTDQKFRFDIDADGEIDEISFLSKGSGFLALDKNDDGVINDGSELFGTKSGNGFKDLAAYDEDGNGWIDEADSIFKNLKIWTKDENGKDELIGIGKAGVGAIYLGNVSTQFSLNEQQTNQTNAEIKKMGMFLKESGEAGTIQHVDFAI